VAAPGADAQPHRQFLHHVEHRDQQQQQQRQQPIAPLGAGLDPCHHIAGVGVRQHHQQAWSADINPSERDDDFRGRSGEAVQAAHFSLSNLSDQIRRHCRLRA
jgi:hypothetical protein